MSDQLAIELVGVDKRFGQVHANKDIHLKVRKGSIHASSARTVRASRR